ncbi:MAG: helix-turn-helix transcriptional regulator [Ruminococcus sp.]|nr:helix-turn-helix transcriptional regulator [Ruminococcus sp.]
MLNQHIAQKIKNLCKEKHISVSAMLKTCSINPNFLYEMDKKNKSPRIDKLAIIAEFLECSIKDFLP